MINYNYVRLTWRESLLSLLEEPHQQKDRDRYQLSLYSVHIAQIF